MLKKETVSGKLTLTSRGFGFVQAEDRSVLIPIDHLNRALSGDRVDVELFPESPRDKPAGKVTRVVERGAAPLIGRVRKQRGTWRLYPQANRSPVPVLLEAGKISPNEVSLTDGDVAQASLLRWENDDEGPVASLVQVISRRGEQDLELRLIALSREIPLAFPSEVTKAAEKIKKPGPKDSGRGRKDLRSLVCFTIDPEQAKDYDDAISVRQLDTGLFEIGIHIADVSAFVQPDDVIDREAWKRGTSVYLVDTVLPMLPEHLSNSVCSLVPGEPRFAVSVLATVDSFGTVHSTEMTESLIESNRRFTYREVEDVLRGKPDEFARELHQAHLLASVLRLAREERGSVDFDFSSRQIRLDENGVPVSIRPNERLAANRLIEELMLLANRLVAERLEAQKRLPGVYRVHDEPKKSDIESLLNTLNELGVPYRAGDEIGPEDYRVMLNLVENFEFRELVETLAVKALPKAVYDTDNRGHFGLAMDAYTHFTSPIRRYPDLVVHRLLKRTFSKRAPKSSKGLEKFLVETCEHSSERERVATEAEREYSRLKAIEFLKQKIGHEYRGVVTGVASVGLFVEIERYLVDGLVHISKLGKEYFELDRANHRLVGKSGTQYRLGDRVRVRVEAVDTERRTADYALVT
ncbi:MAG: ribonuclease R [Spirochaetales bacterium]